MPTITLLDRLSLGSVLIGSILLVVLAMEAGFQLGALRRRGSRAEKDSPVGSVVAATLGLVGFLLAMTYGFAVNCFEARQQALLEEVNSIGTAYLRASFLPEPQAEETRALLREYVQVRMRVPATNDVAHAIKRSEELHQNLWDSLLRAAEKAPDSIRVGLFIQSLNQVIDLHEKRVNLGLRLRIPPIIWFVLCAITLLGMGEIGYQTSLTGSSRTPASLGLVTSFAILLTLLVDLDRPQEGTLRVSQRALQELGDKIKAEAK
jgi:hypothetical protein